MNPSKPIGVLLAQLGTPDAPTPAALRSYLRQFLSDRRVIDYPPLLWQPLLRGVILRVRPARSARLYQRIWQDGGSPLLTYSRAQVQGLQERLGGAFRVILGMTYGSPSIAQAIRSLETDGVERIIVLPMFPQYSSTTTASIYDAVYEAAAGLHGQWQHDRKRWIPTLRFVAPYYDDAGYLDAMRDHLQQTIAALPQPPDQIILTFHGIPKRYVDTGDPYRCQCEQTAARLAQAMGWPPHKWTLCFQSRFGREEWLTPYTSEVLTGLHTAGVQHPLVFSPGFTTDCLETLDELGHEGRDEFAAGGGAAEQYHLAACLNAYPRWLDALAHLVQQNALGWL